MKRTLAILLVLAMIVCMVPAFAVSAAEAEDDSKCTITEYRDQVDTLFDNIVDGKGEGWYYYTGTVAPTVNWQTALPESWTALEEYQVFDNNAKGTIPAGYSDVWQNNGSLWAVRKVTLTAAEFKQYQDKPLTTNMRYCNGIGLYFNGKRVFANNEGGNGWQDFLTTVDLNIKLGDAFKQADGTYIMEDGKYVAYVAAYVYNMNNFWFDMSLEVVVREEENPHTVVTVANADQWNDYVSNVNANKVSVNGSVPVTVTVTGDLDFAGKTIAPINNLKNTVIDFGDHTLSNATYTSKATGNQTALIAVEATDNSVVKNLKMLNCTITAFRNTYDAFVGAVIGWASNASVSNITLEKVTIIDGCDTAGYGGIGAVVGVSNNTLNMDTIVLNQVKLVAFKSSVSLLVDRHGAEAGVATYDNITVKNTNVCADQFGDDVVSQLCNGHVNDAGVDSVTAGDNVDIGTITRDPGPLCASPSGYSSYLQIRDAADGNKDVRIIVVASKAWVNDVADALGVLEFELTFTNGIESVSKTVSVDTVYSSVKAMDGETEVTYTAVDDTYIFGWVVTNVPVEYSGNDAVNLPSCEFALNGTMLAADASSAATEGFSGNPANLFDGPTNAKYEGQLAKGSTATVTWETTEAGKVAYFAVYTAGDTAEWADRNPEAIRLYGSADGVDYTLIADITDPAMGATNNTPYYFFIAGEDQASYQYYKIEFDRIAVEAFNNWFQIGEIELYTK